MDSSCPQTWGHKTVTYKETNKKHTDQNILKNEFDSMNNNTAV